MPTNGDVLTYNDALPDKTEFATPVAGAGDMLKATYDANNDGKVGAADTADSVAWSGVTGKPSTFPPDTHTHAQADVTNLVTDLAGKAAAVHTHPIADVTGLTSALASKSDVGHAHAWSEITSKPTPLTAALAADVSMPNAQQWYDAVTLNITESGWYLLLAQCTIGRQSTILTRYGARIFDGTNGLASGNLAMPSQNPHYLTIAIHTVANLTAPVTLKLQGMASTINCNMRKDIYELASGNNATRITAIRIA